MPNPFVTPKFLPWNPVVSRRNTSVFQNNPFGINIDPTRRGLTDPTLGDSNDMFPEQEGNPYSMQPQAPKRPSLAEQYAKIAGDRPNRMAYQQDVEAGSPVINRGKWAKLGAAIAAGGTALGGTPADKAAQFALSAYYEPQRRSDERWKEKNTGLGRLAQFEDSDIQEKLKVMEMENDDYYKDKAEGRADIATSIAQAAEGRAVDMHGKNMQMSELQFKKIKQEIAKAGETTWTDPDTGWTWIEDENGGIKGHKTHLNPTEAATAAGLKAGAESNAKQPNEMAQIGAQGANAAAVARIGADSRENVAVTNADAKKAAAISKLKTAASRLKPDDVRRMVSIDLIGEVTEGRLPVEAIESLQFDESNGTPYSNSGNPTLDQKVNEFITRSIANSRNGGGPMSGTGAIPGPVAPGINPITGKPKVDPAGLGKGRGGN